MTFPVNGSIPGPNDDPSISQGQIQTNFANLVSWSAIDHVQYGAVNSGQHNKVTFATNAPIGSPPFPAKLFTNVQDGAGTPLPNSLSQLFFYSGSAAQSSTQYISGTTLGANGSVMLFGGIIMKWGKKALSGGSANVVFADEGVSAFPNNLFNVTLTMSGAVQTLGTTLHDRFGFGAQATSITGDFFWVAIGN